MKLNGVTVYNIKEVLKAACEKETKKRTADSKRLCNRPRKRPIEELKEENEEEVLEILFSDSDIEIVESVAHRTRARKVG